ncbi:hypothetical protein CDD83_7117 [Cordyceps sp. RAO-2017]|nr:hypothetical protein CDD83_7117 [Cordyceps sp. RAO-2017]
MDWQRLFECSHLDWMKVGITMGNGIAGGTWDDLYLKFDNGTKYEFEVVDQPYRGHDYAVEVNITEGFSAPVVPVKDLRSFSIISHSHNGNSGDEWELGTLVLYGRCAGSKKEVIIDKFDNIYDWYDRNRGFARKMDPADWHLVDPATGRHTTDPGDF